MMLVPALFALITVIAVIIVFAMTAGVVAPTLAMLTGCFVGPVQPAFFLPPLIPSAFFARLVLAAIPALISALAPEFILALFFLPLSIIFLILSFPFYLRCRSGGRRLRGWCRGLRQGAGGSQKYDSCYKR